MTLEDFFTLTEMKDGLMALTRVEELVSVMRAEKDSVVTNVGEAARQWCTVASTLAATETKDSLSHFIQLDGLDFLDRWLQEAKRCRNDTSDSSLEESIVALLGALEKLPIDKEKSVSSGISITVKDLFDDKSSIVQEKARALFNSWNQRTDKDVDHQEVEKNGGCHDNGVTPVDATAAVESASLKQSVLDSSPVEGSTDLVNHVVQPIDGELPRRARSSDSSQLEGVKEVNVSSPNDQDMCQTKLNCVGKEDGGQGKAQDTSVTSPCQGSLAIMEDQKASMEICSSSNPAGSNIEGRSLDVLASKSLDVLASKSLDVLAPKSLDVLASKASSNDGRETEVIKGTQERFGRIEACSVSVSVSVSSEHVSSSVDPANVQHSTSQPTLRSTSDAKECEFSLKKTLSADLDSIGTLASKPKVGTIGGGGPKHSRGSVLEATVPTGGSHSDVLQETPNTASSLRKPEDLKTSFSRKEDTGAINNLKELGGEPISKIRAGKKSATVSAVSKSMMGTKILDKIDTRRSDMELDYGVEDALEVARQVAKEVEREVVDYREEFCSSSSEKDSGGFVQPGSPNSINREQEQPATGLENEVRIRQNLTSGAISPKGKDHLKSTENMDKDKDCMQDPDSSQVTEAAQEPVVNTDKSMCDFDLNKEVSSEEMDHPTTPTSAPITVVSASRAAAPGFPLAPLHFEGKLGWKGSAATSAFRPASLCRTSDGEKTVSIDGNVQSSKQRQDFHDIDLNVAGGDHDGAIDLVVQKPVPASSDLHSGESSVEVSSRIAERLKLDLNRLGDNEETPSDWRMEGGFHQYHRNGHYSPSPASSSSSRAPSMRNIDLNDNPSLFDHSNDHRPDHGKASSLDMNTCGGIKLDDPVISIMGTRVEVNKKESILQTRSFLPNGQVSEPLIGANFARASGGGVGMRHAMTYSASPPMFGYNGIQAGPSMSLSPAMYGPGSVPYMVDSRGSPVLPQIMGSPVGVPPSYSRPQFLMSMTSPLSGMNGVGAVRPNLDLNSGMAFVEAENREPGGLRQLFIPGQGMITEEQMRSASQPMSSGVGVKRKEPDGSGWDLFPVGYKQKSPWH